MAKLPARRVYLVMAGANILLRSTMYIVLAVYYVLTVHMSPLQLVLVGTVLESTYLVCGLPTGILADMYSRRWCIIAGWLTVGACFVGEALVPSFGIILLAEAVRGFGEACIDGADSAWLADEVGDEQVGPLLVRSSQIGQIAGIVGTIAGVALASIRLNLPVGVGGVAMVGLGLFFVFTMPEAGFRPAPRDERTHWTMMNSTLRDGLGAVRASRVLLLLLVITFFAGAASEGFDRLWEAHLIHSFQFPGIGTLKPVVWFGIISLAGGAVTAAAISILRPRLNRTLGEQGATARALMALYALRLVSVLIFGVASSFAMAVVALLTKGVVGALARPLYETWLIQNIPSRVRATVLSMSSQSDAIGQIAGGPGVGLIGNLVSIRAAIVASGILLSPTLPLFGQALRRREPALARVDAPAPARGYPAAEAEVS